MRPRLLDCTSELDLPSFGQQNVGALDVAVDDAARVEVDQPTQRLPDVDGAEALWKRAEPLEQISEAATVAVCGQRSSRSTVWDRSALGGAHAWGQPAVTHIQ